MRAAAASYAKGVRAERVRRLKDVAEIVDAAPFGSERFLDLAQAGGYDLLCHHAARVGDYRSPDFDVAGALADNTHNLGVVLDVLAKGGAKGVVLTGSVFEQDEGAGEAPLIAFSPYGLSKGLTAAVVSHRCREVGLGYAKFVIPNPFGPLEEPRFCAYLVRTWKKARPPRSTPRPMCATTFPFRCWRGPTPNSRPRPRRERGRRSSTRAAMSRARAPSPNASPPPCARGSGSTCRLDLATQTEFSEPMMRINTESAARYVGGWDEQAAWDEAAAAYRG